MAGPSIAGAVFPAFNSLQVKQAITPMGVLNTSVLGGVVLFIADSVIHAFIGGKYGYSYVRPLIHGVAGGLIGGGIVGGLFDPPGDGASGSMINVTPQGGGSFLSRNPIVGSSQPYLSAQGVKLHGR